CCSASMGPRSFDRGKVDFCYKLNSFSHCFNGAAVFRPRKDGPEYPYGSETTIESLQWGRGLSTAERPLYSRHSGDYFVLQWGRGLSTAESRGNHHARHDGAGGFNGAAVFRPRKELAFHANAIKIRSFNGAAVFRPRKEQPGQ